MYFRICLEVLARLLVATQTTRVVCLHLAQCTQGKDRRPGYWHGSDRQHIKESCDVWSSFVPFGSTVEPEGSLPVRPGTETGSPCPGAPTCRSASPPVMNRLFTIVDYYYHNNCSSASSEKLQSVMVLDSWLLS